MKKGWIILLAVVGVVVISVLLVVFASIGKYNIFITKNQAVNTAWSQVENVLQRRHDLIPNLVSTVQGIAQQEQEVFIRVAEARSSWSKAGSIPGKMDAANAMSGALLNLMAVAERYPEIKSNQNFLALQDELAGTENRISVERRRYNESVQNYNVFAQSFPNNFLVRFFGMPSEREFFKAEEGAKAVPKVEFNIKQTAPAPAVK